MNAEIHRTLADIGEVSQLALDALSRLENALRVCAEGFERGDTMVIIPDNLPVLLGNGVAELFKKALAEKTGLPIKLIDLIPMETTKTSHTIVKMPKNTAASPQAQPNYQLVKTSSDSAVGLDALSVNVIKKAPRPMNCWIIFRDAMAKDLKIEFPQLTVQELCKCTQHSPSLIQHAYNVLASFCSDMWKDLGPTGKAPWQAAAQSAKEEHLRQHPDYKYSPRKPGEKKKRQSRKAKRASAISTVPEVVNFQVAPNIAISSPSSTYENALPVNDITSDIGNPFINDFAPFFDVADMLDMFPQDPVSASITYDSESFRHARLDNEFGFNFNMDATFALADDDLFAFRDGADDDAILPALAHDTY
jgi:transcription factor SOX7/8/10/18 (SOX group E/F)